MRRTEPNTRSNKFFDEEEFNMEVDMGREWFEGDVNMEVILYKVNTIETQQKNIYGETPINSVKTYTPITLKVFPSLQSSTNKTLNGINARHSVDGEFSFLIYTKQLEELDTTINYGDFIGYRVSETEQRYFEVFDDDYLNFSNNRTIVGFKNYYKEIKCKAIQKDKFNGL